MKSSLLALLLVLSTAAAERPAKWAEKIERPGVPNFHRVSGGIYRSAQPGAGGMRAVEKLGIETVLNLRDFNDDEREARGTKLRLVTVDMSVWRIKDGDVALVLALLRDAERGPFLIHCHHGADRTGVIMAMFRMVEQGWSREDAIREMCHGGYGFHRVWVNIVHYLEKVDVEKMRARVDAIAARKP